VSVQSVLDEVVAGTPRVRWSIAITGAPGHAPETAGHAPGTAGHAPGARLRTASIGKILLLLETARQIEEGVLDPAEMLRKRPELAVADSGLWQHLATGALPVADVATLIGAVSDNFATNVLLDRIGAGPLAELTARLGLRETALNDRVRNKREAHHPPTLSNGSAAELAGLMGGLARRELVSAAVSERVDGWLATNTDLSMVAAGIDLDPLAHVVPERGWLLRNKTGTDTGIRADVGYLVREQRMIAYAVLANWEPSAHEATSEVLAGMRAIGAALGRPAAV
jgi:beta-lactamase class A